MHHSSFIILRAYSALCYHYTVSKQCSVSVVIPVFNDADMLTNCLDALALQTVAPYEVIVVDNNSTDHTRQVARSYPFVTLIVEPSQGVVHARTAGFNRVRGDIIGRIDADTIVSPDWVAKVQQIFMASAVDAVSGSMQYHHAPWAGLFSTIDYGIRQYLAWSLGRQYALQGANMAVRASAWHVAKSYLCSRGNLHEDFDLSIHLRECGYTTVYEPSLHVAVAFRQVAGSWGEFSRYVLLNPGTYAQHNIVRCAVMYPVAWLAIVAYPLLHILYLGYDDTKNGFSWTKLFSGTTLTRVNPATFVD